jgi:uncharacterized protein YbbK (DUF523 family)
MQKILVSSCLLGNPVRYNGLHAKPNSDLLDRWISEGRVIAVCPELAAGFLVPRPAAEIRGGNGLDVLNGMAQVVTQNENNLTRQYVLGARQALEAARLHNIRIAVFTDGSPSCGALTSMTEDSQAPSFPAHRRDNRPVTIRGTRRVQSTSIR